MSTFPDAVKMEYGTLVYRFKFTFDGTSGYGASGSIVLPEMPVPGGFMVEKLFVYSNPNYIVIIN